MKAEPISISPASEQGRLFRDAYPADRNQRGSTRHSLSSAHHSHPHSSSSLSSSIHCLPPPVSFPASSLTAGRLAFEYSRSGSFCISGSSPAPDPYQNLSLLAAPLKSFFIYLFFSGRGGAGVGRASEGIHNNTKAGHVVSPRSWKSVDSKKAPLLLCVPFAVMPRLWKTSSTLWCIRF